tara:strand:+ start:338 stop:583 length:246 start_codon:yes stop_codon:yes gene_type:complete
MAGDRQVQIDQDAEKEKAVSSSSSVVENTEHADDAEESDVVTYQDQSILEEIKKLAKQYEKSFETRNKRNVVEKPLWFQQN